MTTSVNVIGQALHEREEKEDSLGHKWINSEVERKLFSSEQYLNIILFLTRNLHRPVHWFWCTLELLLFCCSEHHCSQPCSIMYCSYLGKWAAKGLQAAQVSNLGIENQMWIWHENQCAFLVGQIVFNGFVLLPISGIMLIAQHYIFFPNETVTRIMFHCSFCVFIC